MEEWKEYRLGDFMEFNPKISLKKDTVARKITMDQLVPHSRDIYSWTYEPYSGGAKFQNGDTIMARITPCLENGKHAFISLLDENEIAYGSTEYIVIRGRKGISDNLFVYYLTHVPSFKDAAVKSMVGTSGRQRAQVDVLENLTMTLPTITEQKRIADILTKLDDKIALNKRINDNFVYSIIVVMLILLLISLRNDNLEQQAQALFKSWFVDFEPFKDREFIDTEMGKIPEGWKVGTLYDVAEIYDRLRKPLSGKDRENMKRTYPYYGATSCMDFVDNYIFDGIYTLIGEDGSVVKDNGLPYMQYVWGKFWVNNHAHILQGKNGYSTEMIHVLLSITNIQHLVTGAVQAKLSQANMQKILLAIPPSNILDEFRPIIGCMYEMRRKNEDESARLTHLRDSLLPKLMSGELKADEINL
ncbi:MAG: restriction endonuclease subunit S [Bacteroidales bacterium]|nr:restriction endonuclease subunit S [Bacteroidales bacterium]